ncbi:MAG: exonuclease domain-containing protein [Lachnospiraceae bacterium]|nr:exonuclease domain-containing protein [Lachnospiraceae bacterium]MDD7050096.1 exonuclease domain-containing protein [Lachnospiraceae bacterium]
MSIIVLDLEWNQSNSDKKENRQPQVPVFEIIEIGAVKLNEKREIVERFSQLIRPQIYHTMHQITADIIHLQMQELEAGRPFPEVMEEFLKWCGRDYIFATWGPLDLLELQRNMEYYHMKPLGEGPLKFYDVQKLFSLEVMKDKTRKTLEFAIDYFEIEKDIPFHRAFSDAYYTARILERIDNPEIYRLVSFDTFHLPKSRKKEIKIVFPGYAKYISREFEEKKAVMEDREVASTKCYLCRRNLKKKMRWYTPNGKHYYSVAFCDIHGYLKYKVRVKKSEEGKYYAIKTSKFTTEEKVEKLQQLRQNDKELKKQKKRLSNQD